MNGWHEIYNGFPGPDVVCGHPRTIAIPPVSRADMRSWRARLAVTPGAGAMRMECRLRPILRN